MDIDNIPFGTDFRLHLQETLDRCDILLVVVGPRWFGLNEARQPRLFEEADWVRIEVATALAKKIPVIPLLVEGARMPKPGELPADLQGFAFRQAAVLDVGMDFRVHMERLTKSMDRILALKKLPEPPAVSTDLGSFEDQQTSSSQSNLHSTDDGPPATNLTQTDVAEVFPYQSNVANEQSAPVQENSNGELQISDEASVEGRSVGINHADKITTFVSTAVPLRLWLITGAFIAPLIAILALLIAQSNSGFGSLVGSWCEDKSGPTRFKIEQRGTGLVANGTRYEDARVSQQEKKILIAGTAYTLTMLGALVPDNNSYGRINPSYVRCPE